MFVQCSEHYGHLEVEVEEGKKENRSKDLWHMHLSQYIKNYQEQDVYLVTDVPEQMEGKGKKEGWMEGRKEGRMDGWARTLDVLFFQVLGFFSFLTSGPTPLCEAPSASA